MIKSFLFVLMLFVSTSVGCGPLIVGAIAEDAAKQGARQGAAEQKQEIEALKEEVHQLRQELNRENNDD